MRLAAAPGANAGFFVTNYPAAGFLSHERLSARGENLITLRVMGWPDERAAVDYTVNSAIGIPFMTGPVGEAGPVNHVLPAWDLMAGLMRPSPCSRRIANATRREKDARSASRSATSRSRRSAISDRSPRSRSQAPTGRSWAMSSSAPSDGTS